MDTHRTEIEGFDALARHIINPMLSNYENLDKKLLENLKQLRLSPSSHITQEILGSNEFIQFMKTFELTTDTRSSMTMQYLKDVPLMLTIVSAVREGCFARHLQAERQFLKLVFAFDHLTDMKNTNSDD